MADDTTETTTSETTTDATTEATGATTESTASTDAGATGEDTVLATATTDAGTGDEKADSKESTTPTPVPDDAGVPDAYELKAFTVGEGDDAKTIEIDSVLLETITPGLKEAGVTQPMLEKLAPSVVPAIQEQVLKAQTDQFAQVRADWAKEAQADPEIGGKNWTETTRLAARALDHYGAPSEIKDGKETNEFRVLLNESGLGNHPVMIRMFRSIGADLSEDGTFVRNTTAEKENLPREVKNYPEDQPKA